METRILLKLDPNGRYFEFIPKFLNVNAHVGQEVGTFGDMYA